MRFSRIKSFIPEKLLVQIKLFRFLHWYLPYSRTEWLKDARSRIDEIDGLSQKQKDELYKEYSEDYAKYRVKFSEYYYGYRFPELSEDQKKEFLSMRDLQIILQKYNYICRDQRRITDNKNLFLSEFKKYVNRKWMLLDEKSKEEDVQTFLDSYDVIVKPTDSCSGKGVYKICRGHGNARELQKGNLPLMIEECVENVEEIKAFHPASLNTVRVTTITNGNNVCVLGATLRTGNHNSVFDNADAGGFFAEIDIDSGKIVSHGVNEKGQIAEVHPASGKRFMGFQIPQWHEVLSICYDAALIHKPSFIIAWDIAVTPKGIEIIEGNSRPTIELHQIPRRNGIKKKLFSQMDELGLQYRDALILTKVLSCFP